MERKRSKPTSKIKAKSARTPRTVKTTAEKIERHDAWKRDLDSLFSFHAIEHEEKVKCGAIRKAARSFARAIYKNCPNSADRNAAIRKVREAAWSANASISNLAGKVAG